MSAIGVLVGGALAGRTARITRSWPSAGLLVIGAASALIGLSIRARCCWS